jgi:TrmH family RNA methyltransferase
VGRLRRLFGDRRARREEGVFIAQGEVLVGEAVEAGLVREIFFREGQIPSGHLLAGSWVVHELDGKTFDSVNDTVSPQGCLAVCSRPGESRWDSGSNEVWVLVAHGIQDPGNLGTILRSAEAAGARAVVVTPGTVDPWSPKTVRASAGAVMHLPVIEVADLEDVVQLGFVLVGTTSHANGRSENIWEADLSGRLAVVVGNEARGLSGDESVHRWISIPHEGRAESLNVGMAASVVSMVVARSRSVTGMSRDGTPGRD